MPPSNYISGSLRVRNAEMAVSFLVGLITFGAYVATVCPGLPFNDGPELATAASVLSIAHPTGYPIYTLLGRAAVLLPSGLNPVVALNLLGAVLVSISCVLLFQLCVLVLHERGRFQKAAEFRSSEPADWSKIFAAAVASLAFSFSPTVWKQAVEVEVHALQLLLVVLGLILFLSGMRCIAGDSPKGQQLLLLFAYILGISFSNHLTSFLLLPPYFVLFLSTLRWHAGSRLAVRMSVPFFAGLSTYLYLPIRASMDLPLNWGHPTEWSTFIWHVSGRGYRALMAGEGGTSRSLIDLGNIILSEIGWIAIVVGVIGLVSLLFTNRRLLVFLLLLISLCIAWSLRYQIEDINEYLLPAFLAMAISLAFGVSTILSHPSLLRSRWVVATAVLASMLVPIVQAWNALPVADQSSNHLVDDFTRNVFANVRPNSLILTSNWQYCYPGLLYRQVVNKERTDVVVLNKNFLATSWYFHYLERFRPEILANCRPSTDRFLRYLKRYDDGESFDPHLLIQLYQESIRGIVAAAIGRQTVYVGAEIEPALTAGFRRIPEGVMFRLSSEEKSREMVAPDVLYRPSTFENAAAREMKRFYAWILTASASELGHRKRFKEALTSIERAVEIDPTYSAALTLREELRVAEADDSAK